MEMDTPNKTSKVLLYVSLLAFILFAVYILYINQETFYTAHDRSEFLFGAPFFHTLMTKPCRGLAHTTLLSSGFRCGGVGGDMGAHLLCGDESVPVEGKCHCADALACRLPARLSR